MKREDQTMEMALEYRMHDKPGRCGKPACKRARASASGKARAVELKKVSTTAVRFMTIWNAMVGCPSTGRRWIQTLNGVKKPKMEESIHFPLSTAFSNDLELESTEIKTKTCRKYTARPSPTATCLNLHSPSETHDCLVSDGLYIAKATYYHTVSR